MAMSTIQKVDLGCALAVMFGCVLCLTRPRVSRGTGGGGTTLPTDQQIAAAELKQRRRAM